MMWQYYIVFGVAIVYLALKIYYKLSTNYNQSYTCLAGKTAIITGSNTGIGYVTALDFAKRGARVILACRNKEKAENARRKIIKETDNENIVVKTIDMESFDSVRAFAKDINANEGRLDILVNNAGASFADYSTKDGIPAVLQVNHFSGFLLTHLLIDKLKKSAPSRVVTLASNMASLGRFAPEKLCEPPNFSSSFRNTANYCNSKLCNMVFATELAKKLGGTGVTSNVLHPGVILTQIFSRIPSIGYFLVWLMVTLNVVEGAQTTIYVSVSKEVEGVSGKFFKNCREAPLYQSARSPTFARRVWEVSEQIVKLSEHEKINNSSPRN